MKKLKNWFKPQYRIIRDQKGYYRIQSKDWTWPFWVRIDDTQHGSERNAEIALTSDLKKASGAGVVKYLGRL